MRIASVLVLWFTTGLGAAQAASSPDFADYPAKASTASSQAPLQLDRASRRYRTILRDASYHPADFAGHYVLANWGCGAGCVVVAAIDKSSGKVVMFPSTVSDWPDDIEEPLAYHLDSRLLVVHGRLDESGQGVHYFAFDGRHFKPIAASGLSHTP